MRKRNKLYDIRRPIPYGNKYLFGGLNNKVSDLGAKAGMSTSQMGDLFSSIGTTVGNIGGGLIGGNLQSGAGSTISNLGGTAAGIVGKFNPVAGAVVGAASGILGGLTNRMFGSKLNEENIQNIENLSSSAQNADFSGGVDELSSQLSDISSVGGFNNKYIGTDGWFSNKAKHKANELRQQAAYANDKMYNNFNLAVNNANQDSFLNSMYNVAALGGSLFSDGGIMIKKANRDKFTESADRAGMGVQEYARHILANKDDYSPTLVKRANFARNAANWHAMGGNLNDYNNFFIEINNGKTHEQNPLGGVPMGQDSNGTPNLVEQGETIYNDYVYSNRLKLPKDIKDKYNLKSDMTYAEASKKFAKNTNEMPNDTISRRTLDSQLNELRDSQENLKAKRERAKQLRTFNKLSPDEKLGLMQLAQQNAAPVEVDNTQGDIPTQDNIQIPQGYAYGGNIYSGEDTKTNLMDKSNLGSLRSTYGLSTTPIDVWNYDNMWEGAPKYTNSNLPENIPYYQDNITDSIRKALGADSILKYQNSPRYKEFSALQNKPLSYWNTLSDKTGKPIDFLQSNYDRLRTDGKLGWVYRTPEKREQIYQQLDKYGRELPFSTIDMFDNYTDIGQKLDSDGNIVHYLNPNIGNNIRAYIDTSDKSNTTPIGEDDNKDNKQKPLDTWMRYAPIVGSAIGAISSMFSKPDESAADAILNAGREAGKFRPVNYRPIGDYMRYNPFDRDYYINKLNADNAAIRSAAINQGNMNRGTTMASILAADNNAQNQLGNLARQAEEYNLNQRAQVLNFNRGTNQTNSEGFLKAAMANQSALMNSRNTFLNASMQAARLRQAARQQFNAERSANLTNFFNNIGNLGRENTNFNMMNFSPAFAWMMSKDGQQAYKSRQTKQSNKDTNKNACGGKLNKKGGK